MITLARFRQIEAAVRSSGYAAEIEESENAAPPTSAEQFATEAIYVIINSGMSNRVAQPIFRRCIDALRATGSCADAFGHPGKAAAIDRIWADRERYFVDYLSSDDPLAAIERLPWIGAVTRFHLAKIFGGAFAKPDVHLNRLAEAEGTDAQTLCERLARETGYRVETIDLILWRACANGLIDSRAPDTRGSGPWAQRLPK